MDPNETLNRIRQQADAVLHPRGLQVDRAELAAMLARNVEELDQWLSQGGFMPEAWRAPAAARILRNVVTGEHDDKLLPEHGLDWADNGHGYSGRCDCGNWARTDVETFDALLALYEIHLRASGVREHRTFDPNAPSPELAAALDDEQRAAHGDDPT